MASNLGATRVFTAGFCCSLSCCTCLRANVNDQIQHNTTQTKFKCAKGCAACVCMQNRDAYPFTCILTAEGGCGLVHEHCCAMGTKRMASYGEAPLPRVVDRRKVLCVRCKGSRQVQVVQIGAMRKHRGEAPNDVGLPAAFGRALWAPV